jgi:hypothetical protein
VTLALPNLSSKSLYFAKRINGRSLRSLSMPAASSI